MHHLTTGMGCSWFKSIESLIEHQMAIVSYSGPVTVCFLLEKSNEHVALQKEENVLAQEAELDALLRSEERHNHWSPWDGEHQLAVVC